MKKEWSTPKLEIIGDVQSLTQETVTVCSTKVSSGNDGAVFQNQQLGDPTSCV